jgi:hypothetical protein
MISKSLEKGVTGWHLATAKKIPPDTLNKPEESKWKMVT